MQEGGLISWGERGFWKGSWGWNWEGILSRVQSQKPIFATRLESMGIRKAEQSSP